jgi:imidazolonepropionase
MAAAGSVAVILPTTAYILRLKAPPVRDMINCGVVVALGTDFNPNAHCLSMPLVMHLACVNLRMTLNEALAAATINAAHSIGRGATHGSIEVGKVADLLVLSESRWEHLVYQVSRPTMVPSCQLTCHLSARLGRGDPTRGEEGRRGGLGMAWLLSSFSTEYVNS